MDGAAVSKKYDPLRCYMCMFFQGETGAASEIADCHGMPPQAVRETDDAKFVVISYRPQVKGRDPRCSLFVTHPDMLGGIK